MPALFQVETLDLIIYTSSVKEQIHKRHENAKAEKHDAQQPASRQLLDNGKPYHEQRKSYKSAFPMTVGEVVELAEIQEYRLVHLRLNHNCFHIISFT